MARNTKPRTTRPLIEPRVVRGKLLTLTIFQPHFNQAKQFSNVSQQDWNSCIYYFTPKPVPLDH